MGDHIVIGSDGKEVTQKIPKFVSETPWYAKEDQEDAQAKPEQSANKKRPLDDSYEAKRDRYKHYDSTNYKAVVDGFEAKPAKQVKQNDTETEPIVDPYSRVRAVASTRSFKDTAHYLTDLGEAEHDFEEAAEPAAETQVTEKNRQVPMSQVPVRAASPAREKDNSDLEEDYFPKNHTSVYGSLYKSGKWGFKCCGQTDPESICQR